MAELRVKTFQTPTYTEAEWNQKNPYLQHGQVGYEINSTTLKVERYKVGPGQWNDLPYQGEVYPYSDIPTNPIGDADFNMQGYLNSDILHLMLNPYVGAAPSNALNNAGGTNQNAHVFEIGQSVSGPITVNYTVSNPETLVGATPINCEAGGVFSNEGDFANGPIDLILPSALSPTQTSTTTIKLVATHSEGTSNQVNTYIHFYPQVFNGVGPQEDLTPAEAANIPFKQSKITNNYKQSYNFNSNGYLWIFIPSMLNPVNVVFYDESPGALPGATIGMIDKGPMTINNGSASYEYSAFRSTLNITENQTIMRLA